MKSGPLNPVQTALLDEMLSRLGEHFDGFVLVTRVETLEGCSDTHLSYDGGFYTALGLLAQAQHDMVTRRREKEEDGEDPNFEGAGGE